MMAERGIAAAQAFFRKAFNWQVLNCSDMVAQNDGVTSSHARSDRGRLSELPAPLQQSPHLLPPC